MGIRPMATQLCPPVLTGAPFITAKPGTYDHYCQLLASNWAHRAAWAADRVAEEIAGDDLIQHDGWCNYVSPSDVLAQMLREHTAAEWEEHSSTEPTDADRAAVMVTWRVNYPAQFAAYDASVASCSVTA